jgi:hypothetical protein
MEVHSGCGILPPPCFCPMNNAELKCDENESAKRDAVHAEVPTIPTAHLVWSEV